MKFSHALFISLFLIPGYCVSQALVRFTDGRAESWQYKSGDEFNGNEVNTLLWDHTYPWGRNLYCSGDIQYYTDGKNSEVRNGNLILTAKRERITTKAVPYEGDDFPLRCPGIDAGKNLKTFDYTSGMIFSKQKFQYGYFEIRFNADAGSGLWPAFWLYGGNPNDELDIFELRGDNHKHFHVDVHCKSGCKNYKRFLGLARTNWGGNIEMSSGWNEGYNIISAEWQPGFIKWYLNGKPAGYWKGSITQPMWLITNLAVTDMNGAFPGNPSKTSFPKQMNIDYIRVWSKGNATDLNPKPDFTSNVNSFRSGNNAEIRSRKRPVYKRSKLKDAETWVTILRPEAGRFLFQLLGNVSGAIQYSITDTSGKELKKGNIGDEASEVILSGLSTGTYYLSVIKDGAVSRHRFEMP